MKWYINCDNPHFQLSFSTFESAKFVMAALIEVYGTGACILTDELYNVIVI